MKLNTLSFTKGSRKKRTRRGIGDSSAGRGEKGYSKREGNAAKLGFEGGQTPLYRRIPKRGFTNSLREEFDIIQLHQLEKFGLTEVSLEILVEKKLFNPRHKRLKVLSSSGEVKLSKQMNVKAHAFSKSAHEAIIKAGGKVEIIEKKHIPHHSKKQNKNHSHKNVKKTK